MASIESLQEKMKQASQMMSEMQEELQAMTQKADEGTTFDFARLRHLGEQQPFSNHPLKKCSNPAEYLTLLLTILVKQSEVQEDEWLILYRIAAGANYQGDVHELMAGAMNMNETRMLETVKMIQRENLAEAFLADSLTVYKHAVVSEEATRYLADLYDLVGIDAETLKCMIGVVDSIIQGQREYLTADECVMNAFGDIYYQKREFRTAVRFYRKGAEQGDPHAQDNLGKCYWEGNGVEQNYSEAVQWFRAAEEQGLAEAQYHLGTMYHWGAGVEHDDSEAVRRYRIAAEQRVTEAQFHLGMMYDYGDGIPENPEKANKLYWEAAQNGNTDAQCNLGENYYNGKGVARDYKQAASLFQKAAERGVVWAQEKLGDCYRDGKGVDQSWAEAAKWYEKAARYGNKDVQTKLEHVRYYL